MSQQLEYGHSGLELIFKSKFVLGQRKKGRKRKKEKKKIRYKSIRKWVRGIGRRKRIGLKKEKRSGNVGEGAGQIFTNGSATGTF